MSASREHPLRIDDATYAAGTAHAPDQVAAAFAVEVHCPDLTALLTQLGSE
ncbi:MAG: hypothetical protein IT294_13050 [Deltaproteobacteria bacterium]|nr:hypothetical protein [Deltaproteobacteria bacterium]